MGVSGAAPYEVMDADPDDHRPGSAWLLQVDPDVRTSMAVIRESIGVGDRIPRHIHDVDEVILVESGTARAHVDGVESETCPKATWSSSLLALFTGPSTPALRRLRFAASSRLPRCGWTTWNATPSPARRTSPRVRSGTTSPPVALRCWPGIAR